MSLSYYRADTAVLDGIRQRDLAASYRANANPTEDLVARIDALHRAYPDMEPGLLMSLAQAGLDPTSDAVQQIADAGFEKQRREGAFASVGGFISHAKKIGAPLGVAGRALDAGLGGIDEQVIPAVKAGIRTGFVVLETPLQELQTFIRAGGWTGARLATEQGDTSIMNRVRNIVDPTRWDDQHRVWTDAYADAGSSSGREALTALAAGEDVDLGSGFLPAGEVEDTVKRRAGRLTLTVGDAHFGGPGNPAITTGRAVAARVVEPGTTQYDVLSGLVDGGIAWFGDPTAALGAVAKQVRVGTRIGRGTRALRDTGSLALAGEEFVTTPGFYRPVDHTLQGRAAEAVFGDMVDSVTGRITGPRNTVQPALVDQWLTKGGRHVVQKIADTEDFYDLWNATGRKMPVDLTRRLADTRTEQEVMDVLRPALGTELRDAPEFLGFKVKQANHQGVRLAQDMPGAFIDPNDIDQGVEQLDRWLRNAKVTPELRRASVDAYVRNPDRQTLISTLDKIMGDTADELANTVRARDGLSPTLRARKLTQMYNQTVESARTYFVDEIAENRRAAGIVVDGEPLELQSPFLFTEYLNNIVPLPDARAVRRATSKLGRMVDNPVFEKTTGATDALMGQWKRVTLLRGAYTVRVIGEEQIRMAASGLDSAFAHPISFIGALLGDPKATQKWVRGDHRQVDVLGDVFDESAQFDQALNTGWAGWVDDTAYDRHFAVIRPGEDGYERAWAQGVAELHNDPVARMVAQGQDNLDDVKDWFFRRQGRKFRKPMVATHPELATREGADRYIDTLWEGVQNRTGSDPVLMDAIATGRLGGEPIGKLTTAGQWNLSDAFIAHLDDVVGPQAVKGQRISRAGGVAGLGEVWDNATGWMFSWLNTKPTNYLSRSPTFRQRYWERIEEMLPYMDDATRTQAITNAEGVVTKDALKRMRQAAPSTNRSITVLDDADTIAKAHALDQTKNLLYDLSNRGQFFDTFRLLFPFGEAWREVITRWAKIGTENPSAIRRGQQLITGARGSGFFHKDVNGEEVFTYPWSRQVSNALIGMPVDLNGRVAGLSLMTEVLPGVGPVVQIPAAALLPDTPDWDFAREFISPYGEQDYTNPLLAMAPGYAKNLLQYFQAGDPRLFSSTVGSTMDYLASTGEYDTADPDDMRRLFNDSTALAKNVYLLRGLVQFGAPAAPQPEYLVEDRNGDLDVARVILQDFYKMQETDYDGAVGEFLDRYGTDLFVLTQGKSFSIAPKLPVTKQSAEWERSHGEIVGKYDKVWGFFAPSGDTEDFDYQAYVRQFERGDRVSLTPEQRLSLAQGRVGRHLMEKAESRLSDDPTPSEREWLAAVRERVREEYPGYGQMTAGLPARANTDQVVEQLTRAASDPALAGTEQAQAARIYIAARVKALAFANEIGVKTLEAEAAEPARLWLAEVGRMVTAKYPTFQEMFDVVFSREVEAA